MIQEETILLDKINWKRHLIVWTLITLYISIVDPIKGDLSVQIPVTLIITFTNLFAFYSISLYIFPAFWKKNILILALSTIVCFFIFTLLDFLDFRYLLPPLGGKDYYGKYSFSRIIWKSLYSFTFVGIPAVAYFFTNLSLEKGRIQSEKEKSLLLRELNFLKNQFNSHITFNFLNYCYSNVHQISQKTADAIELFSNMLRYSLEIHADQNVPLEKEIEYINNFLELQKLLTSKVCVEFSCEGELKNKIILSRVLITFIENAFKHGQINNPSYPISIELFGGEKLTTLKVSNKKNLRKEMINTGVGQENVSKILQLYYPGKHELKIKNEKDIYTCELNLELS